MSEQILLQLAGVLILGIAVQWFAWRMHLPAILLLLATGLLLGPGSTMLAKYGVLAKPLLDPTHLFGELLLPAVSLAVALILFEGGLTLNLREHKTASAEIWLLVTLGAAVTSSIITVAAHYLLRLEWPMAVLQGAILVVTGPTVIGPLLRQVRPEGKVSAILKWEGIIIDPLGAMVAIVVFETLVSQQLAPLPIFLSAITIISVGTLCGAAAAGVIIFSFRRHWVPDFLHNSFVLVVVLVAFAGANSLRHESGLFAATMMGLMLGNQRQVNIQHVREFKESLTVILISALFIVLGARLTLQQLALIPWQEMGAFLVVLIFLARPLAVLVSTLFSKLTWAERCFLAGMAPRGIVAAAVASVFALRMQEEKFAQAELLVPITFATIIGTVTFYSLTAARWARRLGISRPGTEGVLIAGAGIVECTIAAALSGEGRLILLVDTNRRNIANARLQGLSVLHGSVLSRYVMDEILVAPLGYFLALTSNDEVNALATIQYQKAFSRAAVYQLAPDTRSNARHEKVSDELRGRVLFSADVRYEDLAQRIATGYVIKKTMLTEGFDFQAFKNASGEGTIPLFIQMPLGNLLFFTPEVALKPKAGDFLFSLAPPKVGVTSEAAGVPVPT